MPTIRDVARVAGVSVATVSRVLNASPHVRATTAQRVRAAAAQLRFVPNGVAKSLITRRTHTLGVLLPELYGEFFGDFIRGVDDTARRHGFHLLVTSVRGSGGELGEALRALKGRTDGLIAMTPQLNAGEPHGMPERFPFVTVGHPPRPHQSSLTIQNFEGSVAMIRHLAGLGHRRIAIVKGPEHNYDAAERRRGYRATVAELGLDADPALELPGDFDERSGAAAAGPLLALARPVTAVFAANDAMAIGLLGALRERGVAVPETVALGGFDDIMLARYVDPPLTTVHVDIVAYGARAAELVLDALREPAAPRPRATLTTTLTVRRSTGAAAA